MFSFRLVGFVTLSAILLTITLAESVHRHPVYINFIWTYLLYSSLIVFMCVLKYLPCSVVTNSSGKRDVAYIAFTEETGAALGVQLLVNAQVDSVRLV